MQCPFCNTDNPDGSIFCLSCAMPLSTGCTSSSPVTAGRTGNSAGGGSGLVNRTRAVQNSNIRLLSGGPKVKPSPRLIVMENMQPTGESILLPPPPYGTPVVLGRNDLVRGLAVDIDLKIAGGFEKKVSRKHAALGYDRDHFFIEDLDSTHGTFLNKGKITPHTPVPLKDNDEIRLAELILKFEYKNGSVI